jgi:hypothetical protein
MAACRLLDRCQVWSIKEPLRSHVLAVPSIAVVATIVAAPKTDWEIRQAVIFAALIACGTVAIEATRTVKEPQGTVARDLQSVWYLAIAIVLPPVYALAAPIPLAAYKPWRTRRMIVYRRVFSNATISLAYGAASVLSGRCPAPRALLRQERAPMCSRGLLPSQPAGHWAG